MTAGSTESRLLAELAALRAGEVEVGFGGHWNRQRWTCHACGCGLWGEGEASLTETLGTTPSGMPSAEAGENARGDRGRWRRCGGGQMAGRRRRKNGMRRLKDEAGVRLQLEIARKRARQSGQKRPNLARSSPTFIVNAWISTVVVASKSKSSGGRCSRPSESGWGCCDPRALSNDFLLHTVCITPNNEAAFRRRFPPSSQTLSFTEVVAHSTPFTGRKPLAAHH
ncbi:hypothetical protein BOTBODRAFT_343690 [Botryobasidium botryosum FD-172 SS1]|uniref:Uncharacterized protein n=1 Tax=Botryobasidium botryosum (strain FD-172 SS1) TaxID=930990 RepID=A0A067MSF3_BOTB1|nr:hypothetical protein BOTBODRAFT_343690 [Botryobasidium botryosum FD-172 SS1]